MGGDSSDHSPRRRRQISGNGSSFNFIGLDAALGYYDVFDRDEQQFYSPRAGVQVDDEYDQVDFFPSSSSPTLLPDRGIISEASLEEAKKRLRAAADLSVHAQARVNAQLQKLRGRVSARYRALRQPIAWTPKRTLLRDKVAFVLGVFHIMTSAYWLGAAPTTFYKLYTVKALFLFALRFILYRRDKMHYYLLDFCYYANLLMMVQVWFFPASCELQKIMFAFSMGPLAWSIIAFRNSMIFHSLDKMTSVFLHAFPPIVAWASRWYTGDPEHWLGSQAYACDNDTATVRDLILIPWAPYAIWAVGYYLKIFVISSERIQQRGYHTLFKYVTRKPNSFFGKLAKKLPKWVSPVVFMLWHVIFCVVTFAFAWLMWQHFWLNTIFIVFVFFMSAWNGGNYYFEVFVHKYVHETGLESKAGKQKEGRGSESTGRTSVRQGAAGRHSLDLATALQHSAAEPSRGVVRSHSDSALPAEEFADALDELELAEQLSGLQALEAELMRDSRRDASTTEAGGHQTAPFDLPAASNGAETGGGEDTAGGDAAGELPRIGTPVPVPSAIDANAGGLVTDVAAAASLVAAQTPGAVAGETVSGENGVELGEPAAGLRQRVRAAAEESGGPVAVEAEGQAGR